MENNSDYIKVVRILAILGFAEGNTSVEATDAQTWINGTLDEDEDWFEGKSHDQIRDVYRTWRDQEMC